MFQQTDPPNSIRAALIYNGINSTIDVYRGHVHDMYGSMAAAALTGLIWRSTGTCLVPLSLYSFPPTRAAVSFVELRCYEGMVY